MTKDERYSAKHFKKWMQQQCLAAESHPIPPTKERPNLINGEFSTTDRRLLGPKVPHTLSPTGQLSERHSGLNHSKQNSAFRPVSSKVKGKKKDKIQL